MEGKVVNRKQQQKMPSNEFASLTAEQLGWFEAIVGNSFVFWD